MAEPPVPYDADAILSVIVSVRGRRVILDAHLARIYGVPTKALNQAVKRNRERFPDDFMFRLSREDAEELWRSKSQVAITNRSQIVTGSQKHRDPRFLPYAFTEHGALMAANVLNSVRAVQMSVFVVRAFVKMREFLAANKAFTGKLLELEKKLTGRLDAHEKAILHVIREIKKLMEPAPAPEPKPRKIGFQVKEKGVKYGRSPGLDKTNTAGFRLVRKTC